MLRIYTYLKRHIDYLKMPPHERFFHDQSLKAIRRSMTQKEKKLRNAKIVVVLLAALTVSYFLDFYLDFEAYTERQQWLLDKLTLNPFTWIWTIFVFIIYSAFTTVLAKGLWGIGLVCTPFVMIFGGLLKQHLLNCPDSGDNTCFLLSALTLGAPMYLTMCVFPGTDILQGVYFRHLEQNCDVIMALTECCVEESCIETDYLAGDELYTSVDCWCHEYEPCKQPACMRNGEPIFLVKPIGTEDGKPFFRKKAR